MGSSVDMVDIVSNLYTNNSDTIMKKLLGIVVLCLLWSVNAYSEKQETIYVMSDPSNGECRLLNEKNDIKVNTPNKVKLTLSKEPLTISCTAPGKKLRPISYELNNKGSITNMYIDNKFISSETSSNLSIPLDEIQESMMFIEDAYCMKLKGWKAEFKCLKDFPKLSDKLAIFQITAGAVGLVSQLRISPKYYTYGNVRVGNAPLIFIKIRGTP